MRAYEVLGLQLGTVWEKHETTENSFVVENYVFRWNAGRFADVVRTYPLSRTLSAAVLGSLRFWDHDVTLQRVAALPGGGRVGLVTAKTTYRVLDAALWWMGHAMVGIGVKRRPVQGQAAR
jgi:hypothetical protein